MGIMAQRGDGLGPNAPPPRGIESYGLPGGGGFNFGGFGGNPGAGGMGGPAFGNVYSNAYNAGQARIGGINNIFNRGLHDATAQQNHILQQYPSLARYAERNSVAGLSQFHHGNASIAQGWKAGYGNIAKTLGFGNGGWGIGGPAAQMIDRNYAQQSGHLSQDLTNRGLGMSSVASELQRGPTLDRNLALGNLDSQLRGQAAGYQNQYQQGGLNFRGQSNAAELGQRNLGTQYGVNVGLAGLNQGGQFAGQNLQFAGQGMNALANAPTPPYPNFAPQQYGGQGGGYQVQGGLGGGGSGGGMGMDPMTRYNMSRTGSTGGFDPSNIPGVNAFGGYGQTSGPGSVSAAEANQSPLYTIGQTDPMQSFPGGSPYLMGGGIEGD